MNDFSADSRTLLAMAHPNPARAFLSLCAAAVATLIVLHQKHFTLSLRHPQTFAIMPTHRCGWVLMLSTIWCLYECVHLVFRAPHDNLTARPCS